jgi:hypothetical protein
MLARLRHNALLISYRQIDYFPWLAAWRIARHLNVGVSQWKSISIAHRYSKSAMKELADGLSPDGCGIVKTTTSYYHKDTFIIGVTFQGSGLKLVNKS